jgi:hypothetical protein
MDPPLLQLAPSGHASLLTLRISRSLFPNVGHRVGTDHRAQSDEMDAGSIDWDRAKPRAPDATGIVRPLRVKSVSEAKRMRRLWRHLRAMPSRLGLRLLGAPGEQAAQNVATETARGIGGTLVSV